MGLDPRAPGVLCLPYHTKALEKYSKQDRS